MVTIANYFDVNQALGMKMLLEAAGIPSFIPDEVSAGIAPYLFTANGGVRLQVTEENAEEASRIIREEAN